MSLEIWDFGLPGFLEKFGPFFCDDRVMIVLMIKSTFGALEAQSPFWAPTWSVFGPWFWVCVLWSHFWIRYLADLGRHISAQTPNSNRRIYWTFLDSAIPVSPLQMEQPLAELTGLAMLSPSGKSCHTSHLLGGKLVCEYIYIYIVVSICVYVDLYVYR